MMRTYFLIAFACLLASAGPVTAQQLKLGDNPSSINPSALLELESSNQGLLLTRITDTAQAPLNTSPDGMIIFFVTPADTCLMLRKGGAWIKIADVKNLSTIETDPVASAKTVSVSTPASSGITGGGSFTVSTNPSFTLKADTGLLATQYFVTSKNYLTTETDPIANAKTISNNQGSGILITNNGSHALSTNPNWTFKADTSLLATQYFVTSKNYLTTETDPIANAKTITNTQGSGILITGLSGQTLTSNPSWTFKADTGLLATQYFVTSKNYLTTETDPVANAKTITNTQGSGILITGVSGQTLTNNPNWTFKADTGLLATQYYVDSINNFNISGTTNYVPVFTGTNSIGNSNIKQSSGRVLINTTTDDGTNALQVNGQASAVGVYVAPSSNNAKITLAYNANGTAQIIPQTSADFVWQGGWGKALQMSAYHEIIFTGGTTSSAIPAFVNGSAANYNVRIINSHVGTVGLSVEGINGQTGNLQQWKVNGSVLDAIEADGSLGIKKSNPTEALDVNGNIRFSGALMPNNLAGTTGQVLISQGNGAAPIWSNASSIEADPIANAKTITNTQGSGILITGLSGQTLTSNPSWTFKADTGLLATQYFVTSKNYLTTETDPVANAKTVSITTPANAGITGGGTFTVNANPSFTLKADTGLLATQYYVNNALGSYWKLGGNSVSSAQNFGTTSNYDLPFMTDSTERMRILANGNVGIGITDPNAKLEVDNELRIRRESGSTAQILFEQTGGEGPPGNPIGEMGNFRIGSDGSDIMWQGGGGKKLQMGSYWGMVLMGDYRTIGFPSFVAGTNGAGIGVLIPSERTVSIPLAIMGMAGQTGNLTEWRNSDSTTLSVVDKSGNFGILKTNPSEALDVVGNVRFSGALMPNNLAGTSGQVLVSQGGATAPVWQTLGSSITSLNGLTGTTQTFATGTSGADFNISSAGTTHTFNIPDASATHRGLVTTGTQTFNGNKNFDDSIGIGTSTPDEKLDLYGNAYLHGNYKAYFISNGTSSRYVGAGRNNDFSLISKSSGAWLRIGSNNANIAFFTDGNADSTDTPQIVFDDNGRLGIGKTTPSQALDVVGNIRFSGALMPNNLAGTIGQVLVSQGGATAPVWQTLGSIINSLNGLTGATQTFAVGTSGSDFNINSSGTTHTFNIPDASATHRGLVTTGTQTFNGNKDFNDSVGIGTSTPDEKLDLYGNGYLHGNYKMYFITNSATSRYVGAGENGDLALVSNSSASWLRIGSNNANIAFWSNGQADSDNVPQMVFDENGRLGIGQINPTQALDVVGNVRFSGALMPNNLAGTSGQVLVSQGGGTAPVWQTLSSSGWSLSGNSISAGNFLGTTNAQALVFKANSVQSGYLSTSNTGATSFGYNANANSTAGVAIGGNAQASNTYTTAIGTSANASVSYATALGYNAQATYTNATALGANSIASSATNATAVGYHARAIYTHSTALGSEALASAGDSATAVGYGAQAIYTYGTALGSGALASSASYATAVGFNAHATNLSTTAIGSKAIASANNATAIGYNASATQTNTVILGNGADVGIGTSTPSEKLEVNGDAKIDGTLNVNGTIYTSDIRYKKNLHELINVLSKIDSLHGYTYYFRTNEFKDKNFSSRQQVGMIAQEVEKYFPELVITDKDGYKSLNYAQFTAVLLEAVKEQQAEIKKLQEQNDKNKLEADNKFKSLEQRLDKLEKR